MNLLSKKWLSIVLATFYMPLYGTDIYCYENSKDETKELFSKFERLHEIDININSIADWPLSKQPVDINYTAEMASST